MPRIAPPRISFRRVFAVALTVALVVVAIPAVSRKIASFQPAGSVLQAGHDGWTVQSVAPPSDLQPGDVLLLVNGQEVSAAVDPSPLLRQQSAVVVLRDGEVLETTHRQPPLRIDFAYLILALIGGFYLGIGVYTLLRTPPRTGWIFHLWCLVSAGLYLISPDAALADAFDRWLYLIDEACRLLLPPLTLHFFLQFPTASRKERRGVGRIAPFLYLPALALLSMHALWLTGGKVRFGPWQGVTGLWLTDRIELASIVVFSLAAVISLAWQGLRREASDERRQLLWIAVGMTGGYLPFLFLYLVPVFVGANPPSWLQIAAAAPLILVPLSFAWAVLRYRLWDITIIVRDVTTYTMTLLAGAIGFSVIQLMIRRGIPADFEVTRNLSTIAGGLLVAGLLVPTKRGIGSTLERFQYRSSYSRRRTLVALGHELLQERDLATLSASLRRHLTDALGLIRCNLYLAENYHLVASVAEHTQWAIPEIEVESLEDGLWDCDWRALAVPSLPEVSPSPETVFYRLGYRAAFPLVVRHRRVGLLLVGLKESHIPLNREDCLLIRQLLNQAALAIENAQLLEQLQRQLREVSELKQFNEEIIESSPAGIAVVDERARIVSANLAFSALVGVDRGGLRHRPLQDVLPVDHLPEPEGAPTDFSFEDHRGNTRQVQISGARLFGARGAGMRVIVANDITAIVGMEKALQERERLASLGAVAAGVAHEVNTPLTGISSYAQMLLARTPEGDPRRQLLQKVEQQTFRAARIVGSLLDLSRAPLSDPVPVGVAEVLEECLELHAARLRKSRVTVVGHEAISSSVQALGTAGEIAQVFNNLISNACDAISENGHEGGTIRIHTEETEQGVEITLSDDGPGVPLDDLHRIFQPFFSTKTRNGGTGLGLSISHGIARRLGGDLVAGNEPEGGGRFTLKLRRPVSH